ncbi:MAG: serine hydrolase [Candidatus Paceibacterota bacterium]|jgi:D-alanyl-D-alanine carboxypeptidase
MTKKIKIKADNGIVAGLVVALVLIWAGFYLSYPNFFQLQQKEEEATRQKTAEQKEISKVIAFGHLDLEAKAYVVYNLETGEILAGRNEEAIRPLASVTKLMTALVASEQLDPQAVVTIDQTNGANGLWAGEKWTPANLLALTLVASSNDGATALAKRAGNGQANFVDLMNEQALSLGLTDFHFTNPTGLDDGPALGGQGSALSVAKLLAYLVKNKPELLSATRETLIEETSLDNLNHIVSNTNEVINDLPGLLASKTGYTDQAGGNLAVVTNIGLNRPVAIVVLGSSQAGRFTDTKTLVQATINYYSNFPSSDPRGK